MIVISNQNYFLSSNSTTSKIEGSFEEIFKLFDENNVNLAGVDNVKMKIEDESEALEFEQLVENFQILRTCFNKFKIVQMIFLLNKDFDLQKLNKIISFPSNLKDLNELTITVSQKVQNYLKKENNQIKTQHISITEIDSVVDKISNLIELSQTIQKLKINLMGYSFSDMTFQKFSRTLQLHQNIQQINIRLQLTFLQEEKINILMDSICQIKQLKYLQLNLSDNPIQSQGLQTFAKFLLRLGHLKQVYLSFQQAKIYNELQKAESFFQNLRYLYQVEDLMLSFSLNQLKNKLSNLMFESVSCLVNLKNLHLGLSCNQISAKGMKNIKKLLNLSNLETLELLLGYNEIESFGEIQQMQCPSMKRLLINIMQNFLTEEGCKKLGLICNNYPNLRYLSLRFSQIGLGDQKFKMIFDQFTHTQKDLQKFHLLSSKNLLTCNSAETISQFLSQKPNIITLSLCIASNFIRNKGCYILMESIKKYRTTMIDFETNLCGNNCSMQGKMAYFGEVTNFQYLTSSFLYFDNKRSGYYHLIFSKIQKIQEMNLNGVLTIAIFCKLYDRSLFFNINCVLYDLYSD
ncbi:hypothetical protein TTHERM_000947375 (macronuclear) [Tetrahymena thermophila SB210]|uniref:Kinase domain protein n=1 Tax=Tetrahymena thermophila (strain SB210) TaxID=312017 RepID=W7X377_TETTS|nr:hypothetical protein TTHERM_000947375 [Tetrahymena thermophila SB210]EWS71892.1 hypothetical protein TTHERM_000947375 [Tetrahymena thermophila SB210]|eukprot:XP_012655570.1 hypothetical protein TTHERM_000947375 [Tetrahymena thermophila SB210]